MERGNANYRQNDQLPAIFVPTSKLGCFCEGFWLQGVNVAFGLVAD